METYNPALDHFSIKQLKEVEDKLNQLMEPLPKQLQDPEIVLLNEKQTAELLGVAKNTLRNWRKKEMIFPFVMGTFVLYPVAKIREFLKASNSGVSRRRGDGVMG